MIIKDAIRSLRSNFGKALFYWLTFVLTSMFIFIFFNISMSDAVGVTFINDKGSFATTLTVFVITICMIIIFFANDFFVKNKARDLAVRLVCGATYMQLAEYLLIQTFILLAIAIPAGILLALIMIPILNGIIAALPGTGLHITIRFSAVVMTTIILTTVVFWTTYLNLAFAYRNSASSLLNERSIKIKLEFPALANMKTSQKFKSILFGVLFFLPVILFYIQPSSSVGWCAVGMVGFNGAMKHILGPWLNKVLKDDYTDQPRLLAVLGFFRTDILIMKNNIILFIVSSVLLASILVSQQRAPMEVLLTLLSYVVMSILLSLAIMFKYSTELSTRAKYFRSLNHLGYTEEECAKIKQQEVVLFYLYVFLVVFLYIGNMFMALILHGLLQASYAGILMLFIIVPLAVCCVTTLYYYNHIDKK